MTKEPWFENEKKEKERKESWIVRWLNERRERERKEIREAVEEAVKKYHTPTVEASPDSVYLELLDELAKHKDVRRFVDDPYYLSEFLIEQAKIGYLLRGEYPTRIGTLVRLYVYNNLRYDIEDVLDPTKFDLTDEDYLCFKANIGKLAGDLSHDLRLMLEGD